VLIMQAPFSHERGKLMNINIGKVPVILFGLEVQMDLKNIKVLNNQLFLNCPSW
jgi:hypothetical protein